MKDIDPNKVSVVYHGCNLVKTNVENKNEISSKNGIPYILYVGERGDQDCHKNFTNLLIAYGENNRLKKDFNLLCFGAGGFKQHELKLMLSLNIPLSKVNHQKGNDIQLAQAYENATAVVSPSLYEGFGLPMVEAMTLGSPLVCSRASCFPEIAGNAAKYFDPEDTESISSAIEEVVFSRSIQKDLVQKGLERSKNFTWEKTAKKTLEVYKKQL
jgi:glycosyltransferase involved in cell wall biosynthesis